LGEGRQAIVVIDEILRVVDAGQPLPIDAEVLGALGADREDEGVEAESRELGYGEPAPGGDGDVAEVGDARIGEDLLELAPQAALHLVLVQEDPVLGQTARLDVAVEEEDAAAEPRERASGEQPSGASSDDGDDVRVLARLLGCHGTSRHDSTPVSGPPSTRAS